MSLPGEGVQVSPEVYRDKPVLFIESGLASVLYGMTEFRAGDGAPPAVGDEMTLSVKGAPYYTLNRTRDEHGDPRYDKVEHDGGVMLEGAFRIDEVFEGNLPGCPFVTPTGEKSFWGVKITKVRDDLSEADIDRLESAGLLSMI